ncbi:MAG: xanthine dehydrogenase family protein molybdopterin-binding subunit [Pseudomonadales bacterium]|nr:xanthine dehydrogenase family protein molybdopterin-binding subunit [Pseudomonadales bacterium]
MITNNSGQEQPFFQSKQDTLTTDRRGFLRMMAVGAAGLTLGVNFSSSAVAGAHKGTINSVGEFEPNAFVRISPDNTVYVMMKHLEMGQGSFTGLATLVAEELDADWSQIVAEGAPANTQLYKNLRWGAQGTGGSSAIANSYEQMRYAGAAAKIMLVAAAARKWAVPVEEITVSQGVIQHAASAKKASFGELALLATEQPVPEVADITLKDPKEFQFIGQSLPRKDTGKTNGSAVFTQDVKLEGMLTALVAHPPRFGATLKNFDAAKALQMKGVVDVVAIPSGVAVLAKDFWSANKGREALQISWDESAAMQQSSDELMLEYKAVAEKTGAVARDDGSAANALAGAAQVIEASFEFPYLAHAAMEPMNCISQVTADGCEIWNGEQLQTFDQMAVAQLLGLQQEQVKINMLYAGGSFGRRASTTSDYILESVNIAKQKPGVPVKLVWTREDDTQAGYFRPLCFHKVKAGLDKDGKLLAWQQTIVGQSIMEGSPFAGMVQNGVDATLVEGASTLPYLIPNLYVDTHIVRNPVPVLWWRSVGHTHTAFATEVFFDRLAKAAGQDPVQMRLQLLKDEPRYAGVLKLVAEKAGWGKALPEGHAMGVALHKSFHTYVAQIAEVSLQGKDSFKVEKVFCAVDCGVAVNPDVIRAQMEGGIGFGLSPALVSKITIDKGRVVQSNFHDYQVLRINQMPEVEVHIVPSAEAPTGVGEPGVPPIAPAVANALYALTGQEFDQLPIKMS